MKLPTFVFLAAFGVSSAVSLSAAETKKRVILVTVTTGYRHSSIPTGEKVIQKLATESGAFEIVDYARQPAIQVPHKPSEPKKLAANADDKAKAKYDADLKAYQEKLAAFDPVKAHEAQVQFDAQAKESLAVLLPANLNAKGIDGVIFESTTGDLPLPDKQGFIDWVKAGHAFIGVHAATDTLHGFKPYIEMIGGEFAGHPWHQMVTVKVEDPTQPGAGSYRDKFEVSDEIYQFKNWDRKSLHVVLSLDPSNEERPAVGTPPKGFFERGERPDRDYAVAWVRDFGTGRVFYTSLGHEETVWNDAKYQEHLLGGIQWALRLVPGGL